MTPKAAPSLYFSLLASIHTPEFKLTFKIFVKSPSPYTCGNDAPKQEPSVTNAVTFT